MKDSNNNKIGRGKREYLTGIPRILSFLIGVTLTLVTFYTAFFGVFQAMIQRGFHLCLLLALTFLWYPATKKSPSTRPSVPDFIFVVFSILIAVWTIYSHDRFLTRIWYYSKLHPVDILSAYILVGLVLEAGRRTLGLAITIIASVFILYAFLGPYMPVMLAHRGMTITKFADLIYLTSEGLFSSLMGISATILFGFISFGTFLQATKTDKYYLNICMALAGKRAGGPAKVAVLSSAAMGTISGSTIANVVTTGTLTIPMMKKTGYKPHEAGAIETASSAAGMIMPPIMGAAAFIMAEVLGIKYSEVVKFAIIPALLYYINIWFLVDFKAKANNLGRLDKREVPNLKYALKQGWSAFLPICVLIVMLIMYFTPFYAGAFCTLFVLVIAMFKNDTRLSFKNFALAIEQCSIQMTSILGVIACATIIVGIINISGLMLKATAMILYLSKGYLIFTIVLVGVLAFFLGMELPISTSYIILSTLGAPSLIKLGVLPVAAHFMIMYFANLATITPPVCMSAFAAAQIAKSDPMRTGFTALKFGSGFYFVPVMFIYSSILSGNMLTAIFIGMITALSIYFLAAGLEGYLRDRLTLFERILCFIIFILIFISPFNNFSFTQKIILWGISTLMICILVWSQKKRGVKYVNESK